MPPKKQQIEQTDVENEIENPDLDDELENRIIQKIQQSIESKNQKTPRISEKQKQHIQNLAAKRKGGTAVFLNKQQLELLQVLEAVKSKKKEVSEDEESVIVKPKKTVKKTVKKQESPKKTVKKPVRKTVKKVEPEPEPEPIRQPIQQPQQSYSKIFGVKKNYSKLF